MLTSTTFSSYICCGDGIPLSTLCTADCIADCMARGIPQQVDLIAHLHIHQRVRLGNSDNVGRESHCIHHLCKILFPCSNSYNSQMARTDSLKYETENNFHLKLKRVGRSRFDPPQRLSQCLACSVSLATYSKILGNVNVFNFSPSETWLEDQLTNDSNQCKEGKE